MGYYSSQNGNLVFDNGLNSKEAESKNFDYVNRTKKNSFKMRTMVRKSTIGKKTRIVNGVTIVGRPTSIFVETGRRFSSEVVAAWNNASKSLARKSLAPSEDSNVQDHGGISLQPSSITRQLAFSSLDEEDESPLRVAFGSKHAYFSRYICSGIFLAKFCAIFLVGVYLLSVYLVKTSEKALDRKLAKMYANGSLVPRNGMLKKNG